MTVDVLTWLDHKNHNQKETLSTKLQIRTHKPFVNRVQLIIYAWIDGQSHVLVPASVNGIVQPCSEGRLGNRQSSPGLNLGLRSANERRRYFVATSLIGWAQA